MDNKKKRKEVIFIAIVFALALSFAFHVSEIMKMFFELVGIIKPVMYGFIIAFILNVPIKKIIQKGSLFAKRKDKRLH